MGTTNASIAGIGVGDLQHTNCLLAADHLLEVAKADAAFADLYLQRARELISSAVNFHDHLAGRLGRGCLVSSNLVASPL